MVHAQTSPNLIEIAKGKDLKKDKMIDALGLAYSSNSCIFLINAKNWSQDQVKDRN